MEETIIQVQGLSKKFCRDLKRSMTYAAWDISRSMLGISYKTDVLRKYEFWALKNISFELKRGEVLGIIGVNGSGKSTLLRLLNGIFPPDIGQIGVKGRIGALISVGAGLHPHMTGKENIYLKGTILGMSREEIKSKFDDIVEFADVGEFIDAPVSTYSSGMNVRLGFSIAINVNPDILMVDEILSVGDLSFRNKSLRKMREYREQAKAIIFISHNMEHVRVLCDRVIVLNKGKMIYDGNTQEGIVLYEEVTRKIRVDNLKKSKPGEYDKVRDRISSGSEIVLEDMGIINSDGINLDQLDCHQPLIFTCKFSLTKFTKSLYFSFGILNEEYKACIWVVSNDNENVIFENLNAGGYQIRISIASHNLAPNVYIPQIAIRNGDTGETYERILSRESFKVVSDGNLLERGMINVKEDWILQKCN